MTVALALCALMLSFAPAGSVGPPWLLALLVALALTWVLVQPQNVVRDDVLPAVAVVLSVSACC